MFGTRPDVPGASGDQDAQPADMASSSSSTVPRKMPRVLFFEAVDAGDIEAAAQLVADRQIAPHCTDNDGNTAVMHAAYLRHARRPRGGGGHATKHGC